MTSTQKRVEPFSKSRTRKRLIKSPKFLIYDLGVRRIAAGEGRDIPDKYMGDLFEQWVGLELLRQMRTTPIKSALMFYRDQHDIEIDWIIERENRYIPVEVKWTKNPSVQDARHAQSFVDEHPNASCGYVLCQIPRAQKLTKNITALPWQDLLNILR